MVLIASLPLCPLVVQTPWHFSIGMFIGVLGFLGVVVPLLREKVGPREKAFWTAVLVILLCLEVRSIHLDQIQHDRDQHFAECESQQRFEQTIRESQQHFDETIVGVEKVFESTKSAASAAKQAANAAAEGVAGLTGADSYVSIMPQLYPYLEDPNNGFVWLLTSVTGRHTVWDVHVVMSEVPLTRESATKRKAENYAVGDVSGTYMSTLTGSPIQPSKAKINYYFFEISSRSPFISQTLALRFNQAFARWEYKVLIRRSRQPAMTLRKMQIIKSAPIWLEVPSVRLSPQ